MATLLDDVSCNEILMQMIEYLKKLKPIAGGTDLFFSAGLRTVRETIELIYSLTDGDFP